MNYKMTKQEWLDCTDPTLMLDHLRRTITDRKMLLFSVGCCRRISQFIDVPVKKTVDTIEKYADGVSNVDALRKAEAEAATWATALDEAGEDIWAMGYSMSWAAWAMSFVISRADKASLEAVTLIERKAQTSLIRDIFGNPFRPPSIAAECLTPTVKFLAQGIYDECAFDRMPILADALENAGCRDSDILDHCRGPGQHVRGCWVVDLVLGKD